MSLSLLPSSLCLQAPPRAAQSVSAFALIAGFLFFCAEDSNRSPEPITHLRWDDPYYDIARHQIVEVAGNDSFSPLRPVLPLQRDQMWLCYLEWKGACPVPHTSGRQQGQLASGEMGSLNPLECLWQFLFSIVFGLTQIHSQLC